ncbi:MAG: hypothetical protein LBN29_09890 [Mediterranea sp.]|jgi:hypothetical protein|nr:hypothetical protein [Mediterranea sp.]
MDTKKTLSGLALLGGEAIIIAVFILFGSDLPGKLLVLNIVVSSLIYVLLFMDVLVPWVDLGDKSGRKIGSLGIRWLLTGLYAFAAIAVMLMGNLFFDWTFEAQIIAHCILVFLLVLGFVASMSASDKVAEVYREEVRSRDGINAMKTAMRDLRDKMSETPDLPRSFGERVESLEERLRFVSPSNSQEAYDLESSFAKTVNDIARAISNFQMNEEAIGNNLNKLERIYQNRKAVYSN